MRISRQRWMRLHASVCRLWQDVQKQGDDPRAKERRPVGEHVEPRGLGENWSSRRLGSANYFFPVDSSRWTQRWTSQVNTRVSTGYLAGSPSSCGPPRKRTAVQCPSVAGFGAKALSISTHLPETRTTNLPVTEDSLRPSTRNPMSGPDKTTTLLGFRIRCVWAWPMRVPASNASRTKQATPHVFTRLISHLRLFDCVGAEFVVSRRSPTQVACTKDDAGARRENGRLSLCASGRRRTASATRPVRACDSRSLSIVQLT